MTGTKAVILSKFQVQILVNHAQKSIPNESCAILFGNTINGEVLVDEVFLTKNIEDSPVNFTISPEELISAYDTSSAVGYFFKSEERVQSIYLRFRPSPSPSKDFVILLFVNVFVSF